jgi:hypothetical protein
VPLPVIFIVRLFLLLGSTRNDARAKDLLRTLTCDGHVLSINSLRVANALWFMVQPSFFEVTEVEFEQESDVSNC